MAENLQIIQKNSKSEQYESLIPQIKSLLVSESDTIANMANVSAALKEAFDFLWVGFYMVKENQLVLGPFQGPIACTRINFGKGVCGTAWKQKEIILVDNVDEFPGHIACSSLSQSEIVVPILKDGVVIGVLDVDSEKLNDFDENDAKYLEDIVRLIKF
ncbi:GAF domain-containing protein [Solitalea koreensis]|uniref:GAF domain-containing protein n=1 Tax=Solitalea koreensis TaxID=543615 RepID=A0A521BD75_9SPHI|nr:GAF domain-containing protein [Solitalea koreensis]SMO45022.1 GAF domain-containing protein [Solitalea koreensis]